jgi:murein L,D-transpeptidase YafK
MGSKMMHVIILLIAALYSGDIFGQNFKAQQLKSSRLKAAYVSQSSRVKKIFIDQGFYFPPRNLLIRVFKKEQVLELWAQHVNQDRLELVKEYPICASSGVLGPKRRRGDLQVPEGFYYINHFNPSSNFHLSLGVSYPNLSDRILGASSTKVNLGGAIYIHGNCVTIGCIPIEDGPMEEVYLAALEARAAGQLRIPIHIFPLRLSEKGYQILKKQYATNSQLLEFWSNLRAGYEQFEKDRRLFSVTVDKKGRYRFLYPK